MRRGREEGGGGRGWVERERDEVGDGVVEGVLSDDPVSVEIVRDREIKT